MHYTHLVLGIIPNTGLVTGGTATTQPNEAIIAVTSSITGARTVTYSELTHTALLMIHAIRHLVHTPLCVYRMHR